LKSHLTRHMKEKHYETNVNLDYVENLDSLNEFECENCEKKFKRKTDLKRHCISVHSVKEKNCFICSHCNLLFSRKDSLSRHVKSKHGE
jgi:uncharacterized Zn-finger protein